MHGKAEVIIGKQRHGPTGTVQLQFDGAVTRFASLAKTTTCRSGSASAALSESKRSGMPRFTSPSERWAQRSRESAADASRAPVRGFQLEISLQPHPNRQPEEERAESTEQPIQQSAPGTRMNARRAGRSVTAEAEPVASRDFRPMTAAATYVRPAGAEAGGILTIDLDAIVANYRSLAARVVPGECAAVVKADAYGCGIDQVTATLMRAGCRTFFVAHLAEARRVRAVAREAAIYRAQRLLRRRRAGLRRDLCAAGDQQPRSSSPNGTISSRRPAGTAARRCTSTPA